MMDEERRGEGAEEPIEDLEAPADAQSDVAGGVGKPPACSVPPVTNVRCAPPSCTGASHCSGKTTVIWETDPGPLAE
jgi:hypothetical protein